MSSTHSDDVVKSGEPVQLTIDQAIDRLGTGPFQGRVLLATGLCNMSDAMEIVLLSFISEVVKDEFNATQSEASLLTSSVFLGALFGTLTLGYLGDHLGRRPLFLASAFSIAAAGLLSALATNYRFMLACRFGVGIGLGGLVVPFDTLAEFVRTEDRALFLLYQGYYWSFGAIAVPAMAYLGMQELDSWRIFLVLCALPCIISLVLSYLLVPESPHWLMATGQADKALEILRQVAAVNGHDPLQTFPNNVHLILNPEEENEMHSVFHLLKPRWRNLTILLWFVWLGIPFCYWGTIQAVTLVFTGSTDEGADFDYGAIFSASLAEVVGQTMVIMMVDRFGRVKSQSLLYLFGAASVFAFMWLAAEKSASRAVLIGLGFLARMFMGGTTSITWVTTCEIMPTQIRTTVGRIGGTCSPWLVSPANDFHIIAIALGSIGVITSILSWHLPETMGIAMGTSLIRSESLLNDKPKTSELL